MFNTFLQGAKFFQGASPLCASLVADLGTTEREYQLGLCARKHFAEFFWRSYLFYLFIRLPKTRINKYLDTIHRTLDVYYEKALPPISSCEVMHAIQSNPKISVNIPKTVLVFLPASSKIDVSIDTVKKQKLKHKTKVSGFGRENKSWTGPEPHYFSNFAECLILSIRQALFHLNLVSSYRTLVTPSISGMLGTKRRCDKLMNCLFAARSSGWLCAKQNFKILRSCKCVLLNKKLVQPESEDTELYEQMWQECFSDFFVFSVNT